MPDRSRPLVEFVNHACVIIDTGSARILCDPWLSGSVFENGWDLLIESGRTIADLDFTHIWFSHEHPDHFSPNELRRLPDERRRQTPVLYQWTRDHKVRSFCEKLGFAVMELTPFEPHRIGAETLVTNAVSAGYDSWLHVRCPGGSILNLNDCRLGDPNDLQRIGDCVGDIDLLMTQFSYANWAGNAGDRDHPERARAKVFAQIEAQLAALRPRYVLPFASFIWFSHAENCFWNETATRIGAAVEKLRSLGAWPVVLCPGDRWRVGDALDNRTAIARWNEAYAAVAGRHLHEGRTIPVAALQAEFTAMQARLKQRNDWAAVLAFSATGDLPPALIYLQDLGHPMSFDIVHGLARIDAEPAACDICLSSESLAYVMKHDWGRATVTINGRFEARYETLWRFFRQTQIAYANNIGKSFPGEIGPDDVRHPKSFILEMLSPEARQSCPAL